MQSRKRYQNIETYKICWCKKSRLYNLQIPQSDIWGKNFVKKEKKTPKNTRAT